MEIQNLTTTKKIPLESTQPFHIYLQQLQTCSKQDLVKKLKEKKKDIHEQTELIIQNSKNYFVDLTTMIMQRQAQIKRNIQNDMLQCLQQIQNKIQELEEESTCSQLNYSEIYQVAKIISTNFCEVEGSHEEIKKYLNSVYQVSMVSINSNTSNLDNTNKIILSEQSIMETNKKTIYGRCSQLSQISQADFEILIQKYQQKQEKNMLNNERLKKKIQSLQQLLSKKGVKDFSKLSEKSHQKNDYFDLQIHRIRSQNKILTEQITAISNKLLTLTSQNQGLKAEIKKYLLPHSQGGLSNRTSLIQDHFEDHSNLYNKQNSAFENICGSQIQSQILIQFQNKNQQLSLQLTKKIKEIQQIREETNKKQQEVLQFRTLLTQKNEQLQKLSTNYQNLSHDYQISCKKKFELQDRIAGMKNFTKQFQRREEDMKSNYQNQILSLKSMLNLKELSIFQYETSSKQNSQKLSQAIKVYQTNLQQLKSSFQSQRKDFFKQIQTLKQSQQKQKIKLQFTKKQISRLNEQISTKQNQVQDLTKQLKEMKFLQQEQLSSKDKSDIQKKELSKLKKQVKQIKKEHETQLKKSNDMFNEKYNMFLERVNTLISQFQKIKQNYEGKIKIYQNRLLIIRQKITYHFHQLATSTSNNKLNKSLNESVQKYIQALNSSTTKNAEIKKLRQELKQLKENKKNSNNNPINNGNCNNIITHFEKDLFMISPEKSIQDHCNSYLYSFQKKVYEERINLQKSNLQEKIKQKDQKIQILEVNLKQLEDKIKQEKSAAQQLKTKRIKQEKEKQSQQKCIQIIKIKTLQQKLLKIDAELKNTKNIFKKCQSQSTQVQTQLKKKKQHIANLKKESQSKEQLIKELQRKLQIQNQQIQRQKRLLKDYSTKQLLLSQMKERTQEYKSLQIQNDNLKKLLQKQEKQLKYQISKKETEIKNLKTNENIQLKKITNQKNNLLEDQLSDLKQKNKKMKNELDRKQTFCNHLKQKYQKNIEQLQKANMQKQIFIQKIQSQISSLQKKYESTYSSLKKVQGRCKLQIVSIKKIFEKVAQHIELQILSKNKYQKQNIPQNHKTKDCTFKSPSSLLTPGYSQIPKDMSSIQIFNQEHYADTLKMFNISMNQFKQIAMKNESEFMNTTNLQNSPILNYQTAKYQSPICNKQQAKNNKLTNNINMKGSLQKLDKILQKPQINVTQIVNIFQELIQKQKQ